jgi:hypothetical protein
MGVSMSSWVGWRLPAAAASLLALAGCNRDRGAGATGSAPPSAGSGAPDASVPHHTAAVDLSGLKLTLSLPGGWDRVLNPYDPNNGTAAVFEPALDSGERGTSFIDISKDVRVPGSAAKAVAEATARDACSGPSACAVLGSQEIPGGYLVSVRAPKDVFVEAWWTVAPGRALRCGFQLSEIVAATLHGGTWLDDPAAVARARQEGEELCQSVKPAG